MSKAHRLVLIIDYIRGQNYIYDYGRVAYKGLNAPSIYALTYAVSFKASYDAANSYTPRPEWPHTDLNLRFLSGDDAARYGTVEGLYWVNDHGVPYS